MTQLAAPDKFAAPGATTPEVGPTGVPRSNGEACLKTSIEQQVLPKEIIMKRLTRRTILAATPAALAFGGPILADRKSVV